SGVKSTKKDSYVVPPEHYFALGDNTQNSADSRYWVAAVLTLNNGEEIKGNYEPNESNPINKISCFQIKDQYGNIRFVDQSLLSKRYYDKNPEPFIHKKLMLGKAMVVFWPIFPHFRWKLLR
ncbi:MAG: S26 family signal peptidase, partial [Planctomycetota bacterium]